MNHSCDVHKSFHTFFSFASNSLWLKKVEKKYVAMKKQILLLTQFFQPSENGVAAWNSAFSRKLQFHSKFSKTFAKKFVNPDLFFDCCQLFQHFWNKSLPGWNNISPNHKCTIIVSLKSYRSSLTDMYFSSLRCSLPLHRWKFVQNSVEKYVGETLKLSFFLSFFFAITGSISKPSMLCIHKTEFRNNNFLIKIDHFWRRIIWKTYKKYL